MKIKYLGTAAAEGIPSPYCTCENCRKAWERRGKDIRSRSQAVYVNGISYFAGKCGKHLTLHG